MLLLWAVIWLLILAFVVNKDLIKNEITSRNLAEKLEISESELIAGGNRMIDYVKGKGDLEITVVRRGVRVSFFGISEKEHLKDVRNVVKGFNIAAVISLAVAVIIITLLILKGHKNAVSRGVGVGTFILLFLIVGIGIYATLRTSDFVYYFHEVLFAGKNYVFNPYESFMVNFFAPSLYKAAAIRVIVICGISVIICEGGLYFLLKQ
ncbi:MAG: DUF1461 domain-containing protein [Lachnospiraceae bacterium]|nr:DUF1461 domain-containing protein [Lachnospiraceae bacterium]